MSSTLTLINPLRLFAAPVNEQSVHPFTTPSQSPLLEVPLRSVVPVYREAGTSDLS